MQSNNIPKITTKETEHLRESYPSLSHLEAGNIAQWLQERKDGLFEMARASENEADMTRVLGGAMRFCEVLKIRVLNHLFRAAIAVK